MKRVTRSTISILLCLIILIGLIPTTVFADDGEPIITVKNSVLSVYEGLAAEVELEVKGDNLKYQWQAEGYLDEWIDLDDNQAYQGTKTPHFQYISNIGWADENDWYGEIPFRCKVTSGNKTAYSQAFQFRFIKREPLKKVVLSGLKEPYYGGTPDYEVASENEKYSVSKVDWYGPATDTISYPAMSETSKFTKGEYICKIYVETNEAYKIDENTRAYLDSTNNTPYSFTIGKPTNGLNGVNTYCVSIPFTVKDPEFLTGRIMFVSAVRYDTPILVSLFGTAGMIDKERVHYRWQRSEDGTTWNDIAQATSRVYTPNADDTGKQVRLVVSADGYIGEIVSEGRTVEKKVNTDNPIIPSLSSIDSTSFKLVNRQDDQEYVYSLTEIPQQNLIDWTSNIIPKDTNTISGLPSHSIVYVYTRFAPTESVDSFYVARSSLYLNDSNHLCNIELEGYTSYGSRNIIYVPINESVTINVNKNPFDADKWNPFKFNTLYPSSLITISETSQIVSVSQLPESITITAGNTTGAIMFGAYYNGAAMNYGTWQVVVYDPQELPPNMLKPKLEQDIPDLVLTVGDSAIPNYDISGVELTAQEAEQFELAWQVCTQVRTTPTGTEQFGDENEYLKVDPTTGLVTALAEIPEDANSMYSKVYLFVVKKSNNVKTQMTSYKVIVYPTVSAVVEGVTVSPDNIGLVSGSSTKLTATVFPANAEATADFTWGSSDETIATVDENGNVTAVKEGSVVITATHKDSGKEGSCVVTVSDNTVSSAQATIVNPVAGNIPNMVISVPKNENYTASIEYWCVEGNNETHLNERDTFEAGKAYSVQVKFITSDGYLFTEKTQFLLNGQEVTVENLNETEVIVSKTFECIESEPEPEIVYGDVNGDTEVTMEDVVMLQKAIAKLVELKDNEKIASDVNFDEKTTMEDVVLIQKYIAKLIDTFNKK